MALLEDIKKIQVNKFSLGSVKHNEELAIRIVAWHIYQNFRKYILEQATKIGEKARTGSYIVCTEDFGHHGLHGRIDKPIEFSVGNLGLHPFVEGTYTSIGFSLEIRNDYQTMGYPEYRELCCDSYGQLKSDSNIYLYEDVYKKSFIISIPIYGSIIHNHKLFSSKFTCCFNDKFKKMYNHLLEFAARDKVTIYPTIKYAVYYAERPTIKGFLSDGETLSVRPGTFNALALCLNYTTNP